MPSSPSECCPALLASAPPLLVPFPCLNRVSMLLVEVKNGRRGEMSEEGKENEREERRGIPCS